MPHHEQTEIAGRIGDIFFHRFVIETSQGTKVLADLGPKGLDAFPIKTGLEIIAEGDMKPSELKIQRIAKKGEATVEIGHKKKEHSHDEHAEPADAKRAIAKAGIKPIGEPRRKPKHFEVLGRKGNALVECHVEFDGHIRKEKPVAPDDHKWSHELQHAA